MIKLNDSNIPEIELSALPAEEQDSGVLLNLALNDIAQYVGQFYIGIQLFEYCRMQLSIFNANIFANWTLLASRDCVMAIWHFRNAMAAANSFANKSSTISPHLNKKALGEAHSLLDKYFPDFAAVRHAVAHAGELSKNEDAHARHAFTGYYKTEAINLGDTKRTTIRNVLQNRTFTSTFEGEIVHCDITVENLNRLTEVETKLFEGFPIFPK
jgi:hypothetical protein